MSTTDDGGDPEWFEAEGRPAQTDLTFAYDDPEDPSIVTVYPEETDARETTWISVDADAAVALADVR